MQTVSAERASSPPPGLKVNKSASITTGRVISNSTAIILAAFFALPMLWMILASVDGNATNQLKAPNFTIARWFHTSIGGRPLGPIINDASWFW